MKLDTLHRIFTFLFIVIALLGIAPLLEAGTITGISVSQTSTETTATATYTFTFTPATTINNGNWCDGAYFWFDFDDDYTVNGATLASISPAVTGMAINDKNDSNGQIRMYTGNSGAQITGGQQYVVVLNGVQNPTTAQTPVNHQIRTGEGCSTIDSGSVAAAAITAAASNPPVVSSPISNKTDLEESAGVTQYVANLNSHFSDSDGDTITYSASSSDSTIVAVILSGTNNRTLSLQAKKWGSANITVTGTTSDGSVQDVFNVTTIGQMPVSSATQGSTETTATTSYTFTFTPETTINSGMWCDGAYFWFNFDDDFTVSGATLGSISPSITGMAINNKNDTNGEIRMYTSSGSITGGQQYTVVLNGVQNPSTAQTPAAHEIRTGHGCGTVDRGTRAAAAIVEAATNPPVVGTPISDNSALAESEGLVQYVADLNQYFFDADGDTMTYSASSSDSTVVAVSLSGVNNKTLSIQALKWGSADVTVTATATDGSVQDVFNVTTIGSLPVSSVTQGSTEVLATTNYAFTFTPESTIDSGVWCDGAYFFFDFDDDFTVSGAILGSITPAITGMAINDRNDTTGEIRLYTTTGSITGGQQYTVVLNGVQNPASTQIPANHGVRTGEGCGSVDVGSIAAAEITGSTKFGDIDKDGNADLLWRNYSTGQNAVWYMSGPTRGGYGYFPTLAGSNWKLVGTGDWDADGNWDLLWRHATSGKNAIWYMNGLVRDSYAYLADLPDLNWKIVSVGDFDGDTLVDDIVWRNTSTGQNSIWYMSNTTRYDYDYLLDVSDLRWKIVGSGDFDNNGTQDLVWRQDDLGKIAIWYMSGATRTGYAYAPTLADNAWQIRAVADYDGDGKPDFAWRNTSTGSNSFWYMNNTARTGYDYLLKLDDQNWVMEGPR